ncbi:RNA-binding domain-containing protein [Paramuribaculum intestinale]|uniref:RNA-binding domain-containing protein n=2 Tax=Muribaculaceae TaxID=2005473 RepID=UPI0025B24DD9|nr:RNA-binding domain-containing protein [Paramuribaculum intestinale]
MTKEELLARLNDIEWDDFEVKEASGGIPKSMWETVGAFSNTAGGWIVLGVRETKVKSVSTYEITGIEKAEKMEQDIISTLRSVSKFNVPILATAQLLDFDGKAVLAFYIPASANKPVYFGNNLNNTFVRVGSGDQRATDIEIDILMREKTFGMKSEMEVDGTGFGDLNTQSLQTYRRRIKDYNPDFRYNDLDDEQFCIKTGIISRGKLTYGGLLMLGKGEIVQEYVPHFWIDYIEIPGTTYSDADCRYTYRMPEQENIWEYFKVLLQRLRLYVDNPFMAGPDGFSPEDNSQLYCLREGLVNLLAHADYFSPMHSTIRVFNDRIEFQNPGRFAVRISDKPGKVKSVPRNPNIIAFFRYARQGENAGYGIDKIMRWTKLTGLEVDFESDITSSTVTYPLPSQKGGQKGGQINIDNENISADNQCNTHSKGGQKEVVRNSGQNQGEETRARIVEAMRKKPEISRRELADIIGISPSAIQKHIEHLKEAEIIIRLGSDRKGLWKVLK